MTNKLTKQFVKLYGQSKEDIRIFTAPGRINLIGEHIDYNGGHVLPAALELINTIIARPNGTDKINMAVTSLPNRLSAELRNLDNYKNLQWGSYQVGVAYILQQAGYHVVGCDLLYHGTVPYGAGLSSSASIEVATGIALAKLGGREEPDMKEIAILCQKAENEYVGMNCGIMDQFISAHGKKDHAILLDCTSLDYELIPLNMGNNTVVITNTNAPHKLTESQYNMRRGQCEQALDVINKNGGDFRCLCDISLDELRQYKACFADDVLYRRARHCVTEEARTVKASEVLKQGDIQAFGRLLCEANESLRDDYETTGKELDAVYDIATGIEGVIGSRMTGGGFGGCNISIVDKNKVIRFMDTVSKSYAEKFGYKPSFYIFKAGDGGMEVVGENL